MSLNTKEEMWVRKQVMREDQQMASQSELIRRWAAHVDVCDTCGGETLRDRFAMAAMQALLSNPEYCISKADTVKYGSGDATTAHYAYSQADAMMEARKR